MGTAQHKTLGRIFNVEVIFSDIDGDGEREVVVENAYLRAVLRFPEKLGYAFYKGRFTWGGRLQSLTYKPTRREFFLPQMLDLENINPFGLPDELFATFPLNTATGRQRRLKMGVGSLRKTIEPRTSKRCRGPGMKKIRDQKKSSPSARK